MSQDLLLSIAINAVDNASSAIKGIGSSLASLGENGPALASVAGAAGLVAGAIISCIQPAADFQSSLTSLATGAGESVSNLKMVGDGILQMAVDTGTSTKQLTDGMYMIESAGYHGADGLNVLKIAAEGAKVGNADLGVTANALTTMLHDYGMSSTQASGAMNALITTVASGKTHLQDLAGA